MKTVRDGKNTIIKEISDFDLGQTLESGQCFHFKSLDGGDFAVCARGRAARIRQDGDSLIFFDADSSEVEKIWIPYFDLERDYAEIKRRLLKNDDRLSEAIACQGGVRILNQEFTETLLSFIISQNKQIPQIKSIVFAISEKYGSYIRDIDGQPCYAFPELKTLSQIGVGDFRELKTGFRAPYLFDACRWITSGGLGEETFKGLDEAGARETLKQIKGVGDKVANCVMLFSLGYRAAFPVDVWIKRIMEHLYFNGDDVPKDEIERFARGKYGEYGGYAQQYLFGAYRGARF